MMYDSNCHGCKFYSPIYSGDYSLEGYTEPEPEMCNQDELAALTDTNQSAAILIEAILFKLSAINNCPFRVNK